MDHFSCYMNCVVTIFQEIFVDEPMLWRWKIDDPEWSEIKCNIRPSGAFNPRNFLYFCILYFYIFTFVLLAALAALKTKRQIYIVMSGQFCTLAMFFFYNNNHKSIETNTQPSRAINLLTLLHFCIFRCINGSVGQWVGNWETFKWVEPWHFSLISVKFQIIG